MEVPGVDHDVAGVRVVDEDRDVVMVGFGLREGVVQHDVDLVGHGLVGVELGNDDPILVRVEQVGQPDHDDVVVVDQCHPYRRPLEASRRRTVIIPRGVHNRPSRWLCGPWFATSAIAELREVSWPLCCGSSP